MLLALGTCALVFFAILIVVRAERRGHTESLPRPESAALELRPGLYVGHGYRLTDALVDMPTVAVIEHATVENDALTVGALDGDRTRIASCPRDAARRLAWMHDGRSILWNRSGLERVHIDSGVAESIVGGPETPAVIGTVSVEPDGPRVFVTMRPADRARFGARVIDLEHGHSIALGEEMVDGDIEGADVVWSKDLAVVLILRLRSRLRQLWELNLRGDGGREIGAAWSSDFSVDPSGSIFMFDHEGAVPMIERDRWLRWWRWLTRPAWAPNGLHVAGTTNGTALWICDAKHPRGEKVLEATTAIPAAEVRSPVWSSDGRFVAFWLSSSAASDRGARMFVVDRERHEIWIAGGSIRALAWRPS